MRNLGVAEDHELRISQDFVLQLVDSKSLGNIACIIRLQVANRCCSLFNCLPFWKKCFLWKLPRFFQEESRWPFAKLIHNQYLLALQILIDTLPIAHYILMLFELLSIFTTLPFSFIPHFLQQQFPGIVFWGPYVTLGISIVFHGAWCIGSRVSEGKKNDSPVEKNISQQKQVTTTTDFPDLFFSGTFLQCYSFVGWRIFESIKWQIISLTFSKFWKFVPLRWCEAQLASLQPMIQEHKISIGGSW